MVLEKSREKITELGHRLKERTTELGKKNQRAPSRKKEESNCKCCKGNWTIKEHWKRTERVF